MGGRRRKKVGGWVGGTDLSGGEHAVCVVVVESLQVVGAPVWVGGWVGGWVGKWRKRRHGGWIEEKRIGWVGGWVGGWVEGRTRR